MKKLALISIALLSLSGCAQRVADLTVASSKNMNLQSGEFVKGDRVKGEDSAPIILFPIGIPQVKEAADNAIETDRCAVGLTDVVVDYGVFAFLVGTNWYEVEGNLVIDKSLPGCENWNG